jgi:hypothetical protein
LTAEHLVWYNHAFYGLVRPATSCCMVLVCEHCAKKGTLDELSYPGKRLRLRCPYCSREFIYFVPSNGHNVAVESSNTVFSRTSTDHTVVEPAVQDEPPATAPEAVPDRVVDEGLIQEAKRIARLIISEIKLYNQEKIAKARSKREVLELLRNDLIKGKQHYNTRIASKLPMGPDYFMESVKDILLTGKN